MNVLATLRIALIALSANKLRSGLTMLGIIIGVAAVIAMISVGAGAQARVEEQIKSLGSNLIIVLPGAFTAGGARLGGGSAQTLTEDDANAIARDVPEVAVVAPSNRGAAQLVAGSQNWNTTVFGVTNEYLEAREWKVIEGRSFEASELSGAGKVVLIGQTVAKNLFGDSNPVDQTIRVRKVPMQIIGVLDRKGQSSSGQDQDDLIMVPLSTARNRLFGQTQGKLRRIGTMMIKIHEGADMKQAEEKIRELLRQRQRLQPGQDDTFTLRNLTEILQTQEAASRVMTLLLAAVASVSLLVGGIGIMNIMLVSVTERTREIGLRMAVGARGKDILRQFLIEAVTLSLIGGIIGVLLGFGVSQLVASFSGWRIEIEAYSIALAVGFAGAIGIFFGYYPARKASQLSPMEALRYE